MAPYFMRYNSGRIHQTLRVTPAMEAGIADHVWTLEEIVRLQARGEVLMATYDQIRDFVRRHSGFDPKTCWIAHVKQLNGLPVRRAWNRRSGSREIPCPPEKRPAIEAALRQLGMI